MPTYGGVGGQSSSKNHKGGKEKDAISMVSMERADTNASMKVQTGSITGNASGRSSIDSGRGVSGGSKTSKKGKGKK